MKKPISKIAILFLGLAFVLLYSLGAAYAVGLPSPSLLWNQSYDSGYDDRSMDVAIDSSGDVISSGMSSNGTDNDWRVIKRSGSDGSVVWNKTYNSTYGDVEAAFDVAIDSNDDVVAVGNSHNATDGDFYAIKYDDSTGNIETGWPKVYDSGYDDGAMGVAIDTSDNVFVFGISSDGTNTNFRVIKYNSGGTQQWNQVYNTADAYNYEIEQSPGSSTYLTGGAIDVDSSGDVVIAGWRDSNNNDWVTIKINSSDGSEAWEKVLSTTYDSTNASDRAYLVKFDGNDDVYTAGYSYFDDTNTEDWRLIKYDSTTGNVETGWGTDGKTKGTATADEWPYDLEVDSNNDAILTGIYNGNYTTVKWDTGGTEDWTATDTAGGGLGVAIDSSNNVITTGVVSNNFRTIKYNSSGTAQWDIDYDSGNGNDWPYEVATDSTGKVVVTGFSNNDTPDEDFRTIQYSSDAGPEAAIPELPNNNLWKILIAVLALGLVIGVIAWNKKKGTPAKTEKE